MPRSRRVPPSQRKRSVTTQAEAQASALAALKRIGASPKVGRPLTYSDELCDRAVAMGNRGQTHSEIAVAFNVSRSTLFEWEREHAAFSNAMTRARAGMQAWWEAHGRKNLKAKHYQANVARLILSANLEDYRERPKPISAELVDFLSAVVDAAGERKPRRVQADGDAAKAVEPLDVVTTPAKR